MIDVRSLTDDELIRYCIAQSELTVLETELFQRFEALVDYADPLSAEVKALEDKAYELEVQLDEARQELEASR